MDISILKDELAVLKKPRVEAMVQIGINAKTIIPIKGFFVGEMKSESYTHFDVIATTFDEKKKRWNTKIIPKTQIKKMTYL